MAGHKKNEAMKKKRERYKKENHLAKNKIRRIEAALKTAGDAIRSHLQERLTYWRKYV